jgi:hypothetical protein
MIRIAILLELTEVRIGHAEQFFLSEVLLYAH